MDTGGLIFTSLIKILDPKRISEVSQVPVTKGESGSWWMSWPITWETQIKILGEIHLSTLVNITMIFVSSLIQTSPPRTRTESRTVDWQAWLISNNKMIGSESSYQTGLGIQCKNIILMELGLIRYLKFQSGSGSSFNKLLEYMLLERYSTEI